MEALTEELYRGVQLVWELGKPDSPRDARSRGSFGCRFERVLAATRRLRWGKPIGGRNFSLSRSSSLVRSFEVGASRPVLGVDPSARPQLACPTGANDSQASPIYTFKGSQTGLSRLKPKVFELHFFY